MRFELPGPFRRPRLGLAFTDRFLLAARLGGSRGGESNGGRRTLQRELPEGMVRPGPVTPNIDSVRELARIAAEMIDALAGRRGQLSLMLPDLSVVTVLVPAGGGDEPGATLAARLGFPPSEARSDFWRGRKGEVLGAAVRRAVLHQYEQVAEAVECRLGWVDAASLARLPHWAESSSRDPLPGVRVQLYRDHYHVSMFRDGELVEIRTRLRVPEDEDLEAVSEEILRLPALRAVGRIGDVVLTGAGAAACARRLSSDSDSPYREVVAIEAEPDEGSQLAASLESLMTR